MTTEVVADVPLLATKLRFGSGKLGGRAERRRARAAAAGDGGSPRARPAARVTGSARQFRWVTTEDWLGGPIEELAVAAAQAELLRRWLAAFGPATETRPALVDRLDAAARRAPRSPRCRTPRSTSTARPATCSPTTSSRRPRRSRRRRCCRRSTRRRWAGRSATGTSARTPRRSSTRTATPARPSGGTAGSSAAGASAATARSRSACSRTSAATRARRSTPRSSDFGRLGRRRPLLAGFPAALPARAGVVAQVADVTSFTFAACPASRSISSTRSTRIMVGAAPASSSPRAMANRTRSRSSGGADAWATTRTSRPSGMRTIWYWRTSSMAENGARSRYGCTATSPPSRAGKRRKSLLRPSTRATRR